MRRSSSIREERDRLVHLQPLRFQDLKEPSLWFRIIASAYADLVMSLVRERLLAMRTLVCPEERDSLPIRINLGGGFPQQLAPALE